MLLQKNKKSHINYNKNYDIIGITSDTRSALSAYKVADFRIFIAKINTKKRILERLEAPIINNLYQQPPPICKIPDRGMFLAPRRESEKIITVKNNCKYVIHGLPLVQYQ